MSDSTRHVTEHLTAYVDGELSDIEQASVAEHLQRCEACAAEHALLASSLAALGELPPVEPSPGLRRQVLAAVEAPPPGLIVRLRALLSPKLLVPASAALAAAAVLAVTVRDREAPQASLDELLLAERLDLLKDYQVVALAPADVAVEDLEAVALLHELGDQP